ncbi:U1 small nuclear ribonucleoprotein C-like [Amphiura filiformis]|uniref:U1 small nuclear ribonucleoprotein C-like n=1 Tax=Amphiura filiformis TaxID=82378 RepID=UPI003B21285F
MKYYCDYCDTYLTHDSPSVRKTHCNGRKHKENVRIYYQKWMEEQAQSLIDKTTEAYQQGKIPHNPFPGAKPGQEGPPGVGPPQRTMVPPPANYGPAGGPPRPMGPGGPGLPPPLMGPPPPGMMMGPPGPRGPMLRPMGPPMMMPPMGPGGPLLQRPPTVQNGPAKK